jgi:hypothetical protein
MKPLEEEPEKTDFEEKKNLPSSFSAFGESPSLEESDLGTGHTVRTSPAEISTFISNEEKSKFRL